ncbi:hypothetical protein [Oligoflexus tunisiensis]|uniref:hypothetical protein n=1 Tax=Oligoflexus tunisiensis TaxID=708132 RepID=UPI00114CE8FB|nr:hypothetical protein [Oligoflexus tunisiensis]
MGESNPLYSEPEPAASSETIPTPEPGLIPRKPRVRWWLAPLWATALYVSTHQAAKAAIASAFLLSNPELTSLLHKPQTMALDGQRFIQRHFLSYGVYIPLEDIVIRGMTSVEPTIVPLMEQSCGEGQAYVWVPLRFQLPVVGEKVLEWCLVKA